MVVVFGAAVRSLGSSITAVRDRAIAPQLRIR